MRGLASSLFIDIEVKACLQRSQLCHVKIQNAASTLQSLVASTSQWFRIWNSGDLGSLRGLASSKLHCRIQLRDLRPGGIVTFQHLREIGFARARVRTAEGCARNPSRRPSCTILAALLSCHFSGKILVYRIPISTHKQILIHSFNTKYLQSWRPRTLPRARPFRNPLRSARIPASKSSLASESFASHPSYFTLLWQDS